MASVSVDIAVSRAVDAGLLSARVPRLLAARAAERGVSVAVDEHLVAALCRAAAVERGDADAVVRAHLRRVAPLAGPARR